MSHWKWKILSKIFKQVSKLISRSRIQSNAAIQSTDVIYCWLFEVSIVILFSVQCRIDVSFHLLELLFLLPKLLLNCFECNPIGRCLQSSLNERSVLASKSSKFQRLLVLVPTREVTKWREELSHQRVKLVQVSSRSWPHPKFCGFKDSFQACLNLLAASVEAPQGKAYRYDGPGRLPHVCGERYRHFRVISIQSLLPMPQEYLHFNFLPDVLPKAGVACENRHSHGVAAGVEVHHKASWTFDGDEAFHSVY